MAGPVQAGRADTRQCGVIDRPAGDRDAQRHRLQLREPRLPQKLVRDDRVAARRHPVQCALAFQPGELRARVRVHAGRISWAEHAHRPTQERRRHTAWRSSRHECHLRRLQPYSCATHPGPAEDRSGTDGAVFRTVPGPCVPIVNRGAHPAESAAARQ